MLAGRVLTHPAPKIALSLVYSGLLVRESNKQRIVIYDLYDTFFVYYRATEETQNLNCTLTIARNTKTPFA
jgi:hypothetical protein